MKDVLFVGAGFSKYLNGKMPLMKDIGERIIEDGWQEKHYNYEFKQNHNVESYMSYLSENYPWESESEHLRKKAAFLEVSRYLADLIASVGALNIQLTDEQQLFFQKIALRDVSVVSLNYDLLFEKYLSKATRSEVQYRYLYQIPLAEINSRSGNFEFSSYDIESKQIKLFKLHGSVNWFYSGKSDYFGETIYMDSPDVGLAAQRQKIMKLRADKVPLIIPPTFSKSSYFNNETIRQLWKIAYNELMIADRIIFFGYSFPLSDSVVKNMIQYLNLEKKEIVLVNPDPKVLENAKVWFPSIKDKIKLLDPDEFVNNYVSSMQQ